MDNVAGVKIPKFEQVTEGVDNKMALTGLGAGGKAIQVPLAALCASSICNLEQLSLRTLAHFNDKTPP
jgi:hypothetical protein